MVTVTVALAGDDDRVNDRGALACARWPMKSQFFFPIAGGWIAFSTRLLPIRVNEWFWSATSTSQWACVFQGA